MNNDRNDDRIENRHNDRQHRLKELDHSDYKIAEDQPDIDGWKIVDTSGKKVGKVKDLLFDETALKVRYIVTNLKNGDWLDDDRKILIPIGQAQLDRDNERVVVPNISPDIVTTLPQYNKVDDLTYEDESRIRNSFAGSTSGDYTTNNFYDHEHYDEDRFYAGNKDRDRDTGISDQADVAEENLEAGKWGADTSGARTSGRIVERHVGERFKAGEEHNANRSSEDRLKGDYEINRDGDISKSEERNTDDNLRDSDRDVSAREPRNRDGDVPERDTFRDRDRDFGEDRRDRNL